MLDQKNDTGTQALIVDIGDIIQGENFGLTEKSISRLSDSSIQIYKSIAEDATDIVRYNDLGTIYDLLKDVKVICDDLERENKTDDFPLSRGRLLFDAFENNIDLHQKYTLSTEYHDYSEYLAVIALWYLAEVNRDSEDNNRLYFAKEAINAFFTISDSSLIWASGEVEAVKALLVKQKHINGAAETNKPYELAGDFCRKIAVAEYQEDYIKHVSPTVTQVVSIIKKKLEPKLKEFGLSKLPTDKTIKTYIADVVPAEAKKGGRPKSPS